jgi:hypothetical protein
MKVFLWVGILMNLLRLHFESFDMLGADAANQVAVHSVS